MKDLLIVVTPHAEKHFDICNTIATEVRAQNISLRRPTEISFLLSGPKSFEGAMLCRETCLKYDLLYAIFEIESVLLAPNEEKVQTV